MNTSSIRELISRFCYNCCMFREDLLRRFFQKRVDTRLLRLTSDVEIRCVSYVCPSLVDVAFFGSVFFLVSSLCV